MARNQKKEPEKKNRKVPKALELTDEQAADVKGGGRVIDCEGYAYLQSTVLTKLKP